MPTTIPAAPAPTKTPSIVRVSGSGGDVVIIRPTGRVTIINGCDPEDADELAKKGRLILEGDRAIEVVRAEGDVEIEGDVNDVLVVEGEAVIVNGQTDDDEDDEDELDDEDDDEEEEDE